MRFTPSESPLKGQMFIILQQSWQTERKQGLDYTQSPKTQRAR